MSVRMNRDSIVCTCAIVVVIVAELIVFSASTVRAAGAQGGATAKSTFQAKCAMCHGPDGAGSSVGKSMNIPNLRSDTVQKTSDAELAQVISDGKGGMPPFKSSLSAAQIHALVKYVRTLRQKK